MSTTITGSSITSATVNTDSVNTDSVTTATVNTDSVTTDSVLTDTYRERVNAIGSTGGGTQDIDLALGSTVTATVDTSANTFTFSNVPANAAGFTLILTNGGSQTVTWPATVDWAAATAPTLTASGVDVITFVSPDAGTTWYGFLAGAAMA